MEMQLNDGGWEEEKVLKNIIKICMYVYQLPIKDITIMY